MDKQRASRHCRKNFRLHVLVLGICFCSIPAFAQQMKDKLEHLMDGYAANGFNGSVIVAKKGVVLLEKGYGYRNTEKGIKNDENTIYRIGQATEPLTSEIILRLDSKGQLGLDERIIKYLPTFPGGDKISIKNLLTHTSGLATYIPDTRIQKNNVCRPIDIDAFTEFYRGKQLLFEPGSRYAYSNADYILLGAIISKISKVRYDYDMGFTILTTCAMRHTGFDFFDLKDNNKATGYVAGGDGKLTEVRATGDTAILFAATGMYTTTGDLYKWHQAQHWYKLLPKDWQDLAYVPFRSQFALGWNMSSMYNKTFMDHEGSYAGFTSCIMRQESDDLFIAVLENKMKAGYENINVAKDILKILYGPEPKKHDVKGEPPTSNGSDPLKKYAGKYVFNSNYALTIKYNGSDLVVESPDQQPITLVQESGNIYKTKGADVQIAFIPDAKGNVNKIILRQNGQDNTGKRVK